MFGWFTHEKQEKKIEYEGDLTVFREAIELAAARREGRECDKRPALVVLGGVLRGVYGGGGVRALERAGLVSGFYSAVGCSTGAPTIA
jgi:predicted Rossmann-fold nucleotide-binding protein